MKLLDLQTAPRRVIPGRKVRHVFALEVDGRLISICGHSNSYKLSELRRDDDATLCHQCERNLAASNHT